MNYNRTNIIPQYNGLYNSKVKIYDNLGFVEILLINTRKKEETQVIENFWELKNYKGGREMQPEGKEENVKRALYRAQATIREKVTANDLRYHFILTYAENMEDKKQAKKDFMLFIMRLNYHLKKKLKYVAVYEVQEERLEETGFAVWHIHFATDEFLKNTKASGYWLQRQWSHGIIRQKRHKGGADKVAGYLAKYFQKDWQPGENNYTCSRGNLTLAPKENPYFSEEAKEQLEVCATRKANYKTGTWLRVPIERYETVLDLNLKAELGIES